MTKQLYWTDTYLFSSEATVLECEKDEKTGSIVVVLDSTIFYPQGGKVYWVIQSFQQVVNLVMWELSNKET